MSEAEHPHTEQPHVLSRRTTPTWEVELLISGVAVFAMLQLPGWLDDAMFALEPRFGGDWRMLLVLSYLYTKSAAVVLAATFVLHLLLRAMWIALVGIRSVYPQGIRMDQLKLGPIQSEIERDRADGIDEAIERADNRASVAFAIGVMIATLFVVVCVVFCGSLFALNLLNTVTDLKVNPMLVFALLCAAFVLPYLAAIVVDRKYGRDLRPGGLPRRIVVGVFRVFGNLGMGVYNNTIMSVLMTNGDRRRTMAMIHGIMLVSLCGVGAAYVLMLKSGVVGNYGLFPSARETRIDAAHYDDQRDPTRDPAVPFVQGMVIEDPYLKLAVPYEPRRVDSAMQRCNAPGKDAREQRALALLACLSGLHPVTLDGQRVAGLRYEAASDPRTGRPVLLAMIDLRTLASGRHELRIGRPPYSDRKPDKDSPDPGEYRIVFWR